MTRVTICIVGLTALALGGAAQPARGPLFELVQPDLFAAPGGQPNAWADADGDGDLDLFVGFQAGKPNRLYRNNLAAGSSASRARSTADDGAFTEVGAAAGVADLTDTRAAAWGDFDGDGRIDLYVGFTRRSETRNRLYRNVSENGTLRFIDVAGELGVDAIGETRQVSWIDFDNDGDLDLFVAFRDAPNLLFRHDASTGAASAGAASRVGGIEFTSVGAELGVADPRRTVGAVWFDADGDGDLDLFTANQNGDTNGFFRNDLSTGPRSTGAPSSAAGGRFVDVAKELGLDAPGRPESAGSNGPSVADYDGDGDLDLFVAGYGRNFLYRNEGGGRFTEVAADVGVAGGDKATPSRWGDYDNDGRPDLYVSSYVDQPLNEHDFLYHNDLSAGSSSPRAESGGARGGRFADVRQALGFTRGATHGVQWVDFDNDGDLDLALANNNPSGAHPLYRNLLRKSAATRSVSVPVRDERGRQRLPGTEVRVYAAGTRRLLGMGMFDTGSGYCSQNVMPVHIGLGSYTGRIDVQVKSLNRP